MKTKKMLVFILVAMLLLTMSACSSENTDVDPDVDDGTVVDEPLEGTKVYDYEDEGEIFFDYPASYSHSDNTGMLTFKNPDESLTIMVKATIANTNDLESTIEYYESYNTFEEFTQEDITVAGYDALRISYLDDWGDYQMSTLIKLGDDANSFDGISFYASSTKGKDLLSDPELKAMMESVRVTE